MNKEQFLAMSLPYGLKIQVHREDELDIIRLNANQYYLLNEGYHFDDFKPILNPLSDLIKEIEHKGERFSAIIRLSEMEEIKDIKSFEKFIFSMIEDYFHLPFLFVQQLIEWHFDICGLIESGEAIDVNSLSENPYK